MTPHHGVTPHPPHGSEARVATAADADVATEILVDAFYDDPAWSFGFPDPAKRRFQQAWFWRRCVLESLPHSTLWITTNGASTSVWLPPGVVEDFEPDPSSEFALEAREVLGGDADRFLQAVERFEAAHPHDEPHYYLSLLGTHSSQRGHGFGLSLLEQNLQVVDAAGMPAYLEVSNPANLALYERHGFRLRGGFDMPDDGPHLPTMWREAR